MPKFLRSKPGPNGEENEKYFLESYASPDILDSYNPYNEQWVPIYKNPQVSFANLSSFSLSRKLSEEAERELYEHGNGNGNGSGSGNGNENGKEIDCEKNQNQEDILIEGDERENQRTALIDEMSLEKLHSFSFKQGNNDSMGKLQVTEQKKDIIDKKKKKTSVITKKTPGDTGKVKKPRKPRKQKSKSLGEIDTTTISSQLNNPNDSNFSLLSENLVEQTVNEKIKKNKTTESTKNKKKRKINSETTTIKEVGMEVGIETHSPCGIREEIAFPMSHSLSSSSSSSSSHSSISSFYSMTETRETDSNSLKYNHESKNSFLEKKKNTHKIVKNYIDVMKQELLDIKAKELEAEKLRAKGKPPKKVKPEKQRKLKKNQKKFNARVTTQVDTLNSNRWPSDLKRTFLEALRSIITTGRSRVYVENKKYGRNELISCYIYHKTGSHRSTRQIASHMQVLKRELCRYLQSSLRNLDVDTLSKVFEHRVSCKIDVPLKDTLDSAYLNVLYLEKDLYTLELSLMIELLFLVEHGPEWNNANEQTFKTFFGSISYLVGTTET